MNELKIPTNLECNSIETISLNEQTNYRLIETGKIKNYLEQEIKYQQLLTSKLSKYLTGFEYADKILTVFLTVLSGTHILGHVRGRKQLLETTTRNKNKKEKPQKLLYLAKKKLDCVEMLVSKSVMDGTIDHNEFLAIMKEKKDYDNQKNESDKSKIKEIEIV